MLNIVYVCWPKEFVLSSPNKQTNRNVKTALAAGAGPQNQSDCLPDEKSGGVSPSGHFCWQPFTWCRQLLPDATSIHQWALGACSPCPPEKAMAPHSSTFAWKIPRMEEPGRLKSWGRWGSDMTKRLHFDFSLSRIGEGNGNPLQCSCLENPRGGGAWWAAVYGVAQNPTQLKRLSSSSSSSNYSKYFNYFSKMLIDTFKHQAFWVFIDCLTLHSHETIENIWSIIP